MDLGIKTNGGIFGHAFGGTNHKDSEITPNLVVKVACTLQELYTGCNKLVNYMKKTLNNDGRTTTMTMCSKSIHIKPGYSSKTVLSCPREGH